MLLLFFSWIYSELKWFSILPLTNLYMHLILYIRYAYPLKCYLWQYFFRDRYHTCKGFDSSPPFGRVSQPLNPRKIKKYIRMIVKIQNAKLVILMLIDYINKALSKAQYDKLEDGSFSAGYRNVQVLSLLEIHFLSVRKNLNRFLKAGL